MYFSSPLHEIHDYFAMDKGITMDDDSTIILELGIRDQPSGSKWIKKVIADCKSIKTCFHHSLILQEGVEVVPDYDGSDVERIIFLRFSIHVDNHVAGSGAHCCGRLKRWRDRNREPREAKRRITRRNNSQRKPPRP